MQRSAVSARRVARLAAILGGLIASLFTAPLAIGITRDVIGATGVMPTLVTFGCAVALAASLSTRVRTR